MRGKSPLFVANLGGIHSLENKNLVRRDFADNGLLSFTSRLYLMWPIGDRLKQIQFRVTACLLLVLVNSGGLVHAVELSEVQRRQFARPTHASFPASALYSPQVATLGKMLFFDQRLSRGQNMSCSSCHNPSFGWETPAKTAIGSGNKPLSRHAPTLYNLADAPALFWDGRADSLEAQALIPITNPLEMDMPIDALVKRLRGIRGYALWFDELFPREGVSANSIQVSLATFERTLISGRSDFDDWIGGDEAAISEAAKRGFALFTGKARCVSCHNGWAFTDHKFHDIGMATDDVGRALIDDTNEKNRYAFKTPTLRNIGLRAPYMHNGEIASLEAVIAHYASGGVKRMSRSPLIVPLQLDDTQRQELIAFLETLTEQQLDVSTPVLPAN